MTQAPIKKKKKKTRGRYGAPISTKPSEERSPPVWLTSAFTCKALGLKQHSEAGCGISNKDERVFQSGIYKDAEVQSHLPFKKQVIYNDWNSAFLEGQCCR